jgi:4-amino-4-deoxy-L-arabinose transferase-like glycosyltransferase
MNTVAAPVAQRRHAWAAVFATLFVASQALLWLAYYGGGAKPLIGDEQHYQDAALAILAGGAWMPDTIWPPLQPLLLAAVYALFGTHLLAAQLLQTLLFIACAALLRDLWRRLGGSVAAANIAAALFLLHPGIAAYAHWLWPEIVHLFLLLAALCLLARAPSAGRAFAAGLCIGLAILAKSLLSVFWPAFLLVFVRRERPHLAWRPAVLFVFALALVTAPALLHGWREHGKPMIADSSVYNLWVGLTDGWRSDYVQDMGGATLPAFLASGATPQQRNTVYMEKIRVLVAERGVATLLADQLSRQYFRLFSAKTPLLSQLPGPACAGHLSVYRSPPWLTRTLSLANDVVHALILAAAAFGIAGWRRKPQLPGLLVMMFLGYQFALFALIHVKARFLLPILPFLCGFAGSALVGAATAAMRGRSDRKGMAAVAAPAVDFTAVRLMLGSLLAALLLFLAFSGPLLDRSCA